MDIKRQPRSKLFFEENRDKFNELMAQGKIPHLRNQNLADMDLRGFNLRTSDLCGSYLRGANLSGLDLSQAKLFGASLKNAKVSGCLFPKEIPAEEIRLSLEFGTRIRNYWGDQIASCIQDGKQNDEYNILPDE